jgi:hypothetical protein
MPRSAGLAGRYARSVFINCPFDATYKPTFDAILFAIFVCGFRPRCGLELVDSGTTRIEKLVEMIADCDLGIHDISRVELDRRSNLPRFNMPFELGLFLGAKHYGAANQKKKICLFLDAKQYRYHRSISDISGQDIDARGNTPVSAFGPVRNFLNSISDNQLPGPADIKKSYLAFTRELPRILKDRRLRVGEITYTDRCSIIFGWLKSQGGAAN